MVPSRDCLPTTNLLGLWVMGFIFQTALNNFQLFFLRLLLLETYFLFAFVLVVSVQLMTMVSVQCLFFLYKEVFDSSQPLSDYLSLKMLFVSL